MSRPGNCYDNAFMESCFGTIKTELELVDYAARTLSLLGADFVEVASAGATLNAAALMAAGLLQRVVLGEATFEPPSTDVYSI